MGLLDCRTGDLPKKFIVSKVIALLYVIRENDDLDLEETSMWDLNATLGTPHEGPSFAQDNVMVHNIILMNISDGSDAFTYVKPHIKKDNGILDFKSLRKKYKNATMQE